MQTLFTRLGLRQGLPQDNAVKILSCLKNGGKIPKMLFAEVAIGKSSFYHLMKFLRKWGFIRKEYSNWKLDSEFSARAFEDTKFWIDFAGIRRNQPEKVRELINQLI